MFDQEEDHKGENKAETDDEGQRNDGHNDEGGWDVVTGKWTLGG